MFKKFSSQRETMKFALFFISNLEKMSVNFLYFQENWSYPLNNLKNQKNYKIQLYKVYFVKLKF